MLLLQDLQHFQQPFLDFLDALAVRLQTQAALHQVIRQEHEGPQVDPAHLFDHFGHFPDFFQREVELEVQETVVVLGTAVLGERTDVVEDFEDVFVGEEDLVLDAEVVFGELGGEVVFGHAGGEVVAGVEVVFGEGHVIEQDLDESGGILVVDVIPIELRSDCV